VKLGDIARASRAMRAAAFGPGRGVLRRGFTSGEKIAAVIALTKKQAQLLNARHFATVATVMPDGSPEATVVWIETDGKYIYFNTAFPRLKARNLERDPRVAITVFDPKQPYDEVLAIRGRAELVLEGADEHIDKLSRMYKG
jgi:PPOX class probable F420-dependent enzyme